MSPSRDRLVVNKRMETEELVYLQTLPSTSEGEKEDGEIDRLHSSPIVPKSLSGSGPVPCQGLVESMLYVLGMKYFLGGISSLYLLRDPLQ